MIKKLLLLLGGCLPLIMMAQSSPHYEAAYDNLNAMMEGAKTPDFKQAVFQVENAYEDGEMDSSLYEQRIAELVRWTEQVQKARPLVYPEKDSATVAVHASIYWALTDTLLMEVGGDTFPRMPYTYDFSDVWGADDWEQMFATKLLDTRKGNCHSLPYLFKIIAEERGVPAWLSLAPNHIYLKLWNKKHRWYNVELTSGYFPEDAWIYTASYIHYDGVMSSLFMDTLSASASIGQCIVDLAKGHERKFGFGDGQFVLRCCDAVLSQCPNAINALLLKAETLRKLAQATPASPSGSEPVQGEEIQYGELEALLAEIHQLGYRRMPEWMFQNMLVEMDAASQGLPSPLDTVDWKIPVDRSGVEILTLSKGKYEELHDRDSVVQIGQSLFHVDRKAMVGFVEVEDGVTMMEAEVSSRWLSPDPKMAEFPSWSPYNFVKNNPISLFDPDGRAPVVANGPGGGPTTKTWIPVTKKLLDYLGTETGLIDRVAKNGDSYYRVLGNRFELSIHQMFESSPNRNYQPNQRKIPTTIRRKSKSVVPDFVFEGRIEPITGISPHGVNRLPKKINDGQLVAVLGSEAMMLGEIKTSTRLSKSSNDYQLAGMIEHIGKQRIIDSSGELVGTVNSYGGGTLYLITTADTEVGLSLLNYASDQGVTVFQSEMYLDPESSDFSGFRLSQPNQLNEAFNRNYAKARKTAEKKRGKAERKLIPFNGHLNLK